MTTTRVSNVFGTKSRLAVTMIAGLSLGLGGCTETDSFLFDPSVLGRWEKTPTKVPILSRLNSIEGAEKELLETTEPTPADLVPEVIEHRIGPGDGLLVNVFDLPDEGRTVEYQREVDPRGMIELPQLGQIYINGMTSAGAENAIKEAMKTFIARPNASVLVAARRSERYSIQGGVQTPGNFRIPTSNFRLLEALSSAGTFSESPEFIFVIRQVTLSDEASGRPGPAQTAPTGNPATAPSGADLINAINELSAPKPDPNKPAEPPKPGSPGMFQPSGQPATQPSAQPSGQPAARQPELIELPPGPSERAKPVQPEVAPSDEGEMAWVNIDGKWVKVKRPKATEVPSPIGRAEAGAALVAQRIIRVPLQRLVNGDASVNVIIRPGDVIRVPPSPPGTLYVAGLVGRPGAYGVAEGITLLRIIPSAGGLTSLASQTRVDIVRQLDKDHQAMIRVNLAAISEGTHPDIYLKGNDIINVGSNFWAYPAAVTRNGYRMTYGFGFLADRNFGNDIFGAPPTNQFGQ